MFHDKVASLEALPDSPLNPSQQYSGAVENSAPVFQLLVNAIATEKGEAIVLTDLKGTVLFWNEGATVLYGIGARQMLGKPLTSRRSLYGAVDLPGWKEVCSFGTYEADVLDQRSDGTPVWTHTRAGLLRDPDGRSVGIRITARSNNTHRENEERFRALTSLSPDIISIFDKEGKLTFNSAAAWKIHGYGADELSGRSTFDLIHSEDRSKVQAAFAKALSDPENPVLVRYRYLNADGSYIWMEAAARNELANPHLKGVIAVSRDISDRVKAEQTLREEEQRYRMLFAANPHPMLIFDRETLHFIEVNAMALELYGYTRDEFLELSILDIRAEADSPRFGEILSQLSSNVDGGRVPGTWQHRLKSGRLIDVEVVTHSIEWSGRPAHVILVHDVTERLKLEAQLQQTQKLESLGLLAGGIAHDFNNLLTGILGHASLALMEMEANSKHEESFRLIQESARRAAELCRQMLAYSGKGRFSIQPMNLSSFVQSTIDLLRISIGKNCHLLLNLSAEPKLIEADYIQLQQVIMNIVINSAEAIGAHEGVIRLETRHQYADAALLETMYLSQDLPEGEYVVLEISDTGCGMSPETLACVFDPFFTTKFTGRGLGLAAVLGIVRGHRGAIHVESILGKGTTFTLLFPVSHNVTFPAESQKMSGVNFAQTSVKTVLVVDDEISVRATARAVLERQGVSVILAIDGIDGVNRFREHLAEIDVVLLDLMMPRLGGDAALRQMREIAPKARVILMSGFDEYAEADRLKGLGHMGFIQKPFTAQILLEKIYAVTAQLV